MLLVFSLIFLYFVFYSLYLLLVQLPLFCLVVYGSAVSARCCVVVLFHSKCFYVLLSYFTAYDCCASFQDLGRSRDCPWAFSGSWNGPTISRWLGRLRILGNLEMGQGRFPDSEMAQPVSGSWDCPGYFWDCPRAFLRLKPFTIGH